MIRQSIPQQLERYLRSQRRAIETHLSRVADKPAKTNVHELRVAIRRMRSVLWILDRKPNRDLRKLARASGGLRELDVAIKDGNAFHFETGKLKHEQRRRRRAFQSRVADREKRIVKNLKWDIRFKTDSLVHRLAKLAAELSRCKIDFRRKPEVHRLRVLVKRTRYILEALDHDAKPLVEFQDVLGRVHDLETLADLCGKNPAIRPKLSALKKAARHLAPGSVRLAVRNLRRVLSAISN